MKIFLGSETEGRADGLLLPIRNAVNTLLDVIREKQYGNALLDIGVISIIMKDEMYDSGGYPERKYYSKIKREADIRLRLNYKIFCNAKPHERMEIYKKHVWRAFAIAASKAKSADDNFEENKLLSDVKQALGISEMQEVKENKKTIIYLVGETEDKATVRFREVVQMIDPLLDEVREKNYGNALKEMGIFAIILKSESYEENCWKERKYYSSLKKVAEVRLKINYKKFVYAELEDRINMCKELVLKAFEVAIEKIQKDDAEFRGKELISDINEALGKLQKNIYWV